MNVISRLFPSELDIGIELVYSIADRTGILNFYLYCDGN